MPRVPAQLLLILGLAVFLASPASATRLVGRFDIPSMTKKAALIVRGRVLSQEARWDHGRERIHTYSTVKVLERVRGPERTPAEIVVKQVGGAVGDVTMHVDGTARLAVGEEVVLFLRTDGRLHYLVGMANGKYVVRRDAAGVSVSREAFPRVRPEPGVTLSKLRDVVRAVPLPPP